MGTRYTPPRSNRPAPKFDGCMVFVAAVALIAAVLIFCSGGHLPTTGGK